MEQDEVELAKLKPAQARFQRLSKKSQMESNNGSKGGLLSKNVYCT